MAGDAAGRLWARAGTRPPALAARAAQGAWRRGRLGRVGAQKSLPPPLLALAWKYLTCGVGPAPQGRTAVS